MFADSEASSSKDEVPLQDASTSPPPTQHNPRLSHLLRWHVAMYDDMEKYDAANATSLCDELLSTREAGFTLTTAYSGLGAAETVAVQIVEEVRLRRKGSLASNFAPVVVHAACDLHRESHTASENHEPQSRPRHIFRNVLDGCSQKTSNTSFSCRTSA